MAGVLIGLLLPHYILDSINATKQTHSLYYGYEK